jgi:hypothetical protein
METLTMAKVAQLVNTYAPKLDEVEKVAFGMFVHHRHANSNASELNLAYEWQQYKA